MILSATVFGGFILLFCTLGGAFSAVTSQGNEVTESVANTTTVSPEPVTTSTTSSPTSTMVTPTPTKEIVTPPDMSVVCEQLVLTFNSINTILPMFVSFEAGESMGASYPSGKLLLDSNARKVEGCVSYQAFNSPAIIVHIEIVETLELQFPQYEIDGQNWTLSFKMEGCHVVLHYSMLQNVSSTARKLLDMNVIMGELKSIDVVTIISDNPQMNGRNFTLEAEDLIRPRLFDAFNSFAKEELHWVVDPSGEDTNLDGFDAFKLIFKRQMIEINKAYTTT